jgi:hypothetical protein
MSEVISLRSVAVPWQAGRPCAPKWRICARVLLSLPGRK